MRLFSSDSGKESPSYCPKCGHQQTANLTSFCSRCGHLLKSPLAVHQTYLLKGVLLLLTGVVFLPAFRLAAEVVTGRSFNQAVPSDDLVMMLEGALIIWGGYRILKAIIKVMNLRDPKKREPALTHLHIAEPGSPTSPDRESRTRRMTTGELSQPQALVGETTKILDDRRE